MIKVKIRKFVHDENGDKKLVTKGRVKFFKPKKSPSKEEIKKMEFTITDGASCDCEAVTNPGKSTLVMGSKQGDRYVITYISDWSKKKEFKRAVRSIRKGHDCKKQIEEIATKTDAKNGGLSAGSKVDVDVDINEVINRAEKKDRDKNRTKKDRNRDNKTKKRKKKDKDRNKNGNNGGDSGKSEEEPTLENMGKFR